MSKQILEWTVNVLLESLNIDLDRDLDISAIFSLFPCVHSVKINACIQGCEVVHVWFAEDSVII